MLPRRGLRHLERQTVIVNLVGGRTFKGVLVGAYKDSLAVAHPQTILDDGRIQALGGEVWVDRVNVEFVQTVPAEDPFGGDARDR